MHSWSDCVELRDSVAQGLSLEEFCVGGLRSSVVFCYSFVLFPLIPHRTLKYRFHSSHLSECVNLGFFFVQFFTVGVDRVDKPWRCLHLKVVHDTFKR